MKINTKKFYGGASSAGGDSQFEHNKTKFFENKSIPSDATETAFIPPAGRVKTIILSYDKFI